MVYNWDDTLISPLVNYADWDVLYFLYVPPTADDPVVVDVPMAAYFGLADTETGTVTGLPRVAWANEVSENTVSYRMPRTAYSGKGD